MLVDADNRRVDHGIFVIRISSELLKNLLPDPAFTPAHVAGMDHPKIPEPARQIAPGHPRAIAVYDRFHKHPGIPRRAPYVALPARQQIPNPFPLVLA